MPVVLAVLLALSGILAAGGIAIMKTYTTPTTPIPTSTPTTIPTTSFHNLASQQPSPLKLTQQPPTNQTCSGDDCSQSDN